MAGKNDTSFKHLTLVAGSYHANQGVDDKIFDHLFHLSLAKKINAILQPGIEILELGFGEGTVAGELLNLSDCRRTVLEGSSLLALRARETLGGSVTVIETLFEDFANYGAYDLVIATNILEHVETPQLVLGRIFEWLRPNGRCVITVPNSESFHRVIAKKAGLIDSTKALSARDNAVGHLRVYDLGSLSDQVRSAGLKIQRVEGMVLKFLDNRQQLALARETLVALHEVDGVYQPEVYANLYLEVSK